MLPSDMNLKIKTGTVGIIIKFLFLMENLVWGKMIRLAHLQMKSHQTTNSNEVQAQRPAITHKNQEPQTNGSVLHLLLTYSE